jgi:hypothetical protein
MAIAIKTSQSLISSLRSSAFRRVTCDGRTWLVTAIRTHRSLSRQGWHPVSPRTAIERVRTGNPR